MGKTFNFGEVLFITKYLMNRLNNTLWNLVIKLGAKVKT
jgi:hypothetical protein